MMNDCSNGYPYWVNSGLKSMNTQGVPLKISASPYHSILHEKIRAMERKRKE